MYRLFLVFALFIQTSVFAQSAFTGMVSDEAAKPLPYATVALLRPADSVLTFFGITTDRGLFEIKKINNGNYLLQVSYLGFQTYYASLDMPAKSGNYGIIVLKSKPLNLGTTEITAEYIPIIIKKDTVEYNAAAFKTKPDAVAEDLLRKLPGMEVDRSGNIKAMGEDVKNVMVDGKEFFSSDPKVATKNLPADAISKVQVYDKKSEAAELAGIEDNSREKTINLLLKDGRKQAWLGDVSAGGGTDNRYAAAAKVYRFTAKNQFSALGMLNNINRFGFTFQDYLDFNGGLPSLMGGGGSMRLTLNSDDALPVNFGQTINGKITSGAGGLNYSFDIKKKSRIYASYLANTTNRKLSQTIFSRNYTATDEFTENENNNESGTNLSHRLNLGLKDKSDSTRTLLINGNFGLTEASKETSLLSSTFSHGDLIHDLESKAEFDRSGFSGNASFSYLKRGHGAVKLITYSANAGFNQSLSKSKRENILRILGDVIPGNDHQYRDINSLGQDYGALIKSLIHMGNGLFLQPEIKAEATNVRLKREQGLISTSENRTDSLSPKFERISIKVSPGVQLKWNIGKTKLVTGVSYKVAQTHNTLNDTSEVQNNYQRVLPSFSWEYERKLGNRLSLNYISSVNEPSVELMVPILDNTDPQSHIYGNRYLKPETRHDLFADWLLFDQFSQTSVFARLSGSYTKDKIGYERSIDDQLLQTIRLINTKNEVSAGGNIDFSTPLRFMGMNIHTGLTGQWQSGITYVNGQENTTSSFSRSLSLSFDNRKKEKWNLDFGGKITLTDAKFSLQKSLDNQYITWSYYTETTFDPNDHWHFGVTADVENYTSGKFTSAVTIPLISAELSYSFLNNNRGILRLEANDLLAKNTGLERISELNYLREVRSDIIGRYFLLSFKYRINKAAKAKSGLEIKMKNR